jgi:hypothetical protein
MPADDDAPAGPQMEPQPGRLPPPTPLPPEGPRPPAPPAEEPALNFFEGDVVVYDLPGRFWTTGEMLIWRTQHAPLSYPVETATTVGSNGVVGTTGTTNYFDKSNMSYPNYTGARLTGGYWFDAFNTWGVEASGFFAGNPGIHFKSVASTFAPSTTGPGGAFVPIQIFQPFISAPSLTASALLVASQGNTTGFLNVDSGTLLWGGELNGVRSLVRKPNCSIDLIAGFRYLNLTEDLSITSETNAIRITTPLPAPSLFLIFDRFGTRNDFYGGQIGTKIAWHRDCLTFTFTGKVAVGDSHETLRVNGGTTFLSGILQSGSLPGGFYALPSNSGHFNRDDIAVAPQIGLNIGYQAGKHCYFFVGYDFLYWSSVARPGDQLNPVIDPRQIPSSGFVVLGSTFTNPTPLFVTRDFWAMGVNLGLEVKY